LQTLYKKRIKELKPKTALFSKGVYKTLNQKTDQQLTTILKLAETRANQHQRKTINSKDIELAFKEFYESHTYNYLTMLENVTTQFFAEKKQEVVENAMRRRNIEKNA
jgi:histone H3/H4